MPDLSDILAVIGAGLGDDSGLRFIEQRRKEEKENRELLLEQRRLTNLADAMGVDIPLGVEPKSLQEILAIQKSQIDKSSQAAAKIESDRLLTKAGGKTKKFAEQARKENVREEVIAERLGQQAEKRRRRDLGRQAAQPGEKGTAARIDLAARGQAGEATTLGREAALSQQDLEIEEFQGLLDELQILEKDPSAAIEDIRSLRARFADNGPVQSTLSQLEASFESQRANDRLTQSNSIPNALRNLGREGEAQMAEVLLNSKALRERQLLELVGPMIPAGVDRAVFTERMLAFADKMYQFVRNPVTAQISEIDRPRLKKEAAGLFGSVPDAIFDRMLVAFGDNLSDTQKANLRLLLSDPSTLNNAIQFIGEFGRSPDEAFATPETTRVPVGEITARSTEGLDPRGVSIVERVGREVEAGGLPPDLIPAARTLVTSNVGKSYASAMGGIGAADVEMWSGISNALLGTALAQGEEIPDETKAAAARLLTGFGGPSVFTGLRRGNVDLVEEMFLEGEAASPFMVNDAPLLVPNLFGNQRINLETGELPRLRQQLQEAERARDLYITMVTDQANKASGLLEGEAANEFLSRVHGYLAGVRQGMQAQIDQKRGIVPVEDRPVFTPGMVEDPRFRKAQREAQRRREDPRFGFQTLQNLGGSALLNPGDVQSRLDELLGAKPQKAPR